MNRKFTKKKKKENDPSTCEKAFRQRNAKQNNKDTLFFNYCIGGD